MRYQLLQGCSFILAQLYDILFHGVLLDSFFLTPQGYPFSLLSSILLGQTTSYCSDIQSRAYQDGYNQFSDRLKGEVSSTQFIQMWSGKFIDACVPDVIHITGNQATTTLSTHEVRTNATQTYQITLPQDGTNGWRIDSLQPQ